MRGNDVNLARLIGRCRVIPTSQVRCVRIAHVKVSSLSVSVLEDSQRVLERDPDTPANRNSDKQPEQRGLDVKSAGANAIGAAAPATVLRASLLGRGLRDYGSPSGGQPGSQTDGYATEGDPQSGRVVGRIALQTRTCVP